MKKSKSLLALALAAWTIAAMSTGCASAEKPKEDERLSGTAPKPGSFALYSKKGTSSSQRKLDRKLMKRGERAMYSQALDPY